MLATVGRRIAQMATVGTLVLDDEGTPVAVSKIEGRWQVRACGNLYVSRYLDDAVCAALPSLTRRERDRLVISLLQK